ncbi:glycosyltransferase [Prevotella sp. 10(H)]|uniref:glycosyltransferase n=1 Tax=Prevotella sp. 10(H) TaxID=1158294 RepID=UPI00068E444D|nr:glycosyltransferase [Prevotella sp. 10(H)]
MKLSLIIPVYNVEKYIKACLNSVFLQNYSVNDYEVIIVNDGTPDNSMVIIDEFSKKYFNIKILNQQNQGLSMARNNGLSIATGDYVWFIDSDDTIKSDSLETVCGLIDKYPDVEVFASFMTKVDEFGNRSIENTSKKLQKLCLKGKDYLFREYPFGASQRFIIKKSFLQKNNLLFKKGIYHEDAEFGIKMLYLSSNVWVLGESVYNYLVRSSGSIMSSWKKKNSEDLISIYDSLKSFRSSFVKKEDLNMFNEIMFTLLSCSIYFANNHWKTKDFSDFYKNNKAKIKKEASQFIIPFKYNIRLLILRLFYAVSPLYYSKMKLFLKRI